MTGVIYLVIGCAVAFLAYRVSENFKKANGVTPWHWPSWVWAIVGFFSLILAAVLLFIARRNTKPLQSTGFQAMVPNGSLVGGLAQPGPALVAPSAAVLPGASWQQDPTRRYAARYWDGSRWTDYVSDGSSTKSDPLPV
jgi:drug/metabolite transporter (DMT)-like permease